jgi:tRNA pseudouridine32 synthase/23S rRNA pseudouridine746 synthase
MDESDKVKPLPKQTIDDTKIDEIVNEMYERIRKRQVPLMNLPEATSHEESAFGQLILLGYGNDNESGKPNCRRNHMGLYVVHRLDCETSGIMVFARNQDSASKLCQFWRGRGQVTKVYLAKVKEWKPYQEEQTLEGRIDLPLAPSEERLKWKVAMTTGKPSITLWKLHNPLTGAEPNSIMVELTPLTGRTHQLRVHCASVGSPIEGDSLYGNEKIHWDPMQPDGLMLCLHAHELSFTHPASDEIMKFTSMPSWYEASATCG